MLDVAQPRPLWSLSPLSPLDLIWRLRLQLHGRLLPPKHTPNSLVAWWHRSLYIYLMVVWSRC